MKSLNFPERSLFPPIAEYAFLSDCEVGALIAPSGNVEWLCLPQFDSPAVFSTMLDRGAGGLTARRVAPDGRERCWTILGASRGEGGILGEGIRQALLRDPTYRAALACAREMAA